VFAHSDEDPSSRSVSGTTVIMEDRSGRVWMGSEFNGGGLDMFEPGVKAFRHFRAGGLDGNALPDDNVTALHQDSQGRLWIGTAKGLAQLLFSADSKLHFYTKPYAECVGNVSLLGAENRHQFASSAPYRYVQKYAK
jgi:ligand-binding sensor domain-containing protein